MIELEKLKGILSNAYTEYVQAYCSNETDETLPFPRNEYPDVVSYQASKVMEVLATGD